MKKVEIKIPEMGKREGTLAWVNEQIEEMAKTLHLKDDYPVVMVEHDREIAWVDQPEQSGHDEFYQRKEDVRFVFPRNTDHQEGIFNCPLTPAAEEKVQEFLEEVVNQLIEKWNES